MANPGCSPLFEPCGHYQSPLEGICEVLGKIDSGAATAGILGNSFSSSLDGASDSNTVGLKGNVMSDTPSGQAAVCYHESQHSNGPNPSGAINDCDHAELYYCTIQMLIALALCGEDPGFDRFDSALEAEKAHREKCNH